VIFETRGEKMKKLTLRISLLSLLMITSLCIFPSLSIRSAYAQPEQPWLEVVPETTILGLGPALHEQFTVSVIITGPPPTELDQNWNLVGIGFILLYNETLLNVVKVEEGAFLQDPTWNLYGTVFYNQIVSDPLLGTGVLIMDVLLSNPMDGYDQSVFPNGHGVVATITFEAIKQDASKTLECALTLNSVEGADKDGTTIPFNEANNKNGHYMMLPYANFEIVPDVLNLKGIGKRTAGYIELPESYDANDIDTTTILLNQTKLLDPTATPTIRDHDADGIPDLEVQFNRTKLVEFIEDQGITYGNVTMAVTGTLLDGTPFEGNCTLKVTDLVGDTNCDDVVSIGDVVAVSANYGAMEGIQGWNPNGNFAPAWDKLNILDLVTIISHYANKYPEEQPERPPAPKPKP
jgi:hypothetical protein